VTAAHPRVLCVDDEPYVLEGLRLHLRRGFELVTASGGAEALRIIERSPSFSVILSDMRMPGMDGATFLSYARRIAPDTVRVLLTGHADVDSALAAVNQGEIYRFLTKPCPPEVVRSTLQQAAEHHRLVVTERELLEKTLAGSVKVLVDVLALVSPSAFGRASRIHRIAAGLCDGVGPPDRWAVELAARLSQVGFVALAPGVAEKLYENQPLAPAEQEQVGRAPRLADQLLAHVPRLEPVREILAGLERATPAPAAAAPAGVAILRLAMEVESLEAGGISPAEALAIVEARPGPHPPGLLAALREDVKRRTATTVAELPLGEVKPGMLLAGDVRGRKGVLLVARGQTVSAGLLARLQGMGVREKVQVVVAAGPEPA
jgi:CheY-like chemotaxis protein